MYGAYCMKSNTLSHMVERKLVERSAVFLAQIPFLNEHDIRVR